MFLVAVVGSEHGPVIEYFSYYFLFFLCLYTILYQNYVEGITTTTTTEDDGVRVVVVFFDVLLTQSLLNLPTRCSAHSNFGSPAPFQLLISPTTNEGSRSQIKTVFSSFPFRVGHNDDFWLRGCRSSIGGGCFCYKMTLVLLQDDNLAQAFKGKGEPAAVRH